MLVDGRPDHGLELVTILLELADACRQQIGGHFALVHFVSKGPLVDGDLLDVKFFCFLGIQLQWHQLLRGLQFLQQFGRDCQFIAACQFDNFCNISEGSAHHYCLVPELAEVVIDLGY